MFDWIFFILAGNKDNCIVLYFGPILPHTADLAALERLKNPHAYYGGKSCEHSRACIFDWIFFILTGNKENYQSLDEF